MTINNRPEISCPVIVLAGGLGTRLRSVTQDKPKILAPLPTDHSQSFLIFYLRWLNEQGARHIIFSLGYQAELVITELERLQSLSEFTQLRLEYVVEPKPLGTLGGMRHTFSQHDLTSAVVLNGDTLLDIALIDFVKDAQTHLQSGFSFAAIYQTDTRRFGRAIFDSEHQLLGFQEKQLDAKGAIEGWINAGVYYFSEAFIQWLGSTTAASFESFCLQVEDFEQTRRVFPVQSKDENSCVRFIDIGTPDSWKTLTDWLPTQESN